MADLRLEGTDGEYLILESSDGATHRLLIDDSVRRAIRREVVADDDAQRISPREIQLEIRAGVTMDELAQKTGASLAYIEKFAAPVVDELAHIVASALSVRLTMAGDRYSETTQVEFGEVIANRLAAQGVVQPVWSSRKTENNGWQIHCRFGDNQASWAFDPRKLLLSPENELAVQLSATQTFGDAPLPKLRPVAPSVAIPAAAAPSVVTQQAPVAPVSAAPTASPIAAVPAPVEEPVAPVEPPMAVPTVLVPKAAPAASAQVAPQSGSITEDLGKTAEFDGVVSFGRETGEAAPESDDASGLANTADLLDALRKRRIERERDVISTNTGSISIVPELIPEAATESLSDEDFSQDPEDAGYDSFSLDTAVIEVVAQEVEAVDAADEAAAPAPMPAAEPEKPKAKGRSAMPSWDEIVFNSKPEDQ